MPQNPALPIEQLQQKFAAALRRLPVLVGNEAKNFFLDSFKRQGWQGATFEAWPARKTGGKWKNRKNNKGRALLVDTGRLRRSIRVVSANTDQVVIGTDVPYARAHNEGSRLGVIQQVKSFQRKITKVGVVKKKALKTRTNIEFGRVATGTTTVKAHRRRINQKLPVRRFMGQSPYLTDRLKRLSSAEIMKALQ